MGYHLREIPIGVFGEISKISEEIAELEDAVAQNSRIMELNELSDIIGAVEGYLNNYHSDYTLNDLIIMKDITKRAFLTGSRTSKK